MKNFHCRSQLGNSKHSFKKIISNFPSFLQYIFSKDEMFEEKAPSSKNTAKFKDFTMSNGLVQPFHAGQLKTKKFKVAIFIEPYTSLQS